MPHGCRGRLIARVGKGRNALDPRLGGDVADRHGAGRHGRPRPDPDAVEDHRADAEEGAGADIRVATDVDTRG